MEVILVLLILALLNGAIAFIDEMLQELVSMTLYADRYMLSAGGNSMVGTLFDIMLGFGVSLIILKFLKKGFACYVMWTEGDPDTEPSGLVLRFVEAVVVAVCFPTLYRWLAEVTEEIIDQLMAAIGVSTNYDWQAWVNGISSLGLVTAIFGLVFIICYFMLYFQFLMRGLEITILRIGLPMACVGLLDNDKGVFKAYMNKFFQSTFAVVIQICLCKLGVGMMLNIGFNMNMFWGVACIVLAIKTPAFLRDFLVPTGGGGGAINNIYHSVRLVGMAKSMAK
ncbi:MAG: hypothetical protein HDR14_13950 [Lachnospiraceae bacterium]|nr:hypothetical protein [Lachnospiraceae bacterium]